MKGGLRRLAVIATALAVAVTGTVTGSAAAVSEQAGPQEGAVVVQEQHDALKAAADAGDVTAAKSVLAELKPLLDELENGQRYLIKDSSKKFASSAGDEATTVQQQLDQLFPDSEQTRDLPSVAELLNVLVQRLLLSLAVLVNDLLGSSLPI